jgi:lysine-N-methylase
MAPPPTEETRSGLRPSIRQPRPAVRPQVTTAAMERFTCLADRCEDTCCRDWAVAIDRSSLDRMKEVMSATPAGRDRLVRLVVIGRPSRQSEELAQIQLDERGACPLLEEDNRCGVHAAFGEQALTTTCSIFPRTALAVGNHLEIGGSLGCPEITRLVLLSQGELELRPASQAMLPRPYIGKTVSADPADAYAHHFSTVREVLLRCFQRDYPLGTRLALAADFAQRVQPLFRAGTTEFEGAGRAFAERRLRGEIAHTDAPELAAALHRDLTTLQASGEATTGLIASWLMGRKRLPHAARFGELLRVVFTSILEEALGGPAPAGAEVTPAQIWQIYARRRAALAARAGARSDLIFGNYARHFLFRSPYTDSSTLLEHLYKLGIHLATVRFLTVMHPDLAERLAGSPDPEADAKALDQVAVHVVQTFTKAIGHHLEYVDTLLRAGAESGGFTFGRLVMLAKFV